MILEFKFNYIGDNDVFEYLLNFYAKDYIYDILINDEEYILKIKADPDKLNDFCNSLNNMSHSIFLTGFEVKEGDDFKPLYKQKEIFEKYTLLSFLNSNAYAKENILLENEWGQFCDISLSFDGKNFEKIDKNNFHSLLSKTLDIIKKDEKIWIKNHKGIYTIHLFDKEFKEDFLMPCDIKAISSIFVCSNEQLKFLASFEKPLMAFKLNALFRQKYDLKIDKFLLKLAEDIFLFALGYELFKENFHFLSFKKVENFIDDFKILNVKDKFVVLEGFEFIHSKIRALIFSKNDKNMARISYLTSRFKQKSFILELSKEYDDILLLDKEINLLKITLPNHSKKIYSELENDPTGKRLLDNFQKEFKLLDEEFESKNNFFSLLCIIGRMLNLNQDFKKAGLVLLQLSDQSRLAKGVKIDFKLNDNKEFDYIKTLRSIMSFMLAGVGAQDISYGVIESLSYFLRDFYDELKQKDKTQVVLISGSLFEHKSLLENVFKHIKDCRLSNVPLRV
ncbi:hypothetical protein JG676_05510 [Campylobacter sp. 2018MI35]|uniref:hypothetical protein n=1 Tax=Campylobacter sp. 2018MI34 TaxID=2800582 RepID=UPI0019068B76|nr:hypothetical protein [Campylobacter sp. 2018MI34]MBK1992056.1 hypothetical protein [Campylobacter sp. 2018MI34]